MLLPAVALAALLLAPSTCTYREGINATTCTFGIVADRIADPGEVVVVRGQVRSLDGTVQRLSIALGSHGSNGEVETLLDRSAVAISENGWRTWGSVSHPPGIDSHFRWSYAAFAGNEVGNVRIRTSAVIRPAN